MGRSCGQNGKRYECFQNLRKETLGRPRSRWEGNIRMDLKEIGASTRNRVDLAKERDD